MKAVKAEVTLCPCPWCKKTPHLRMPIGDETWLWRIECINSDCLMRPITPYVAIRKTSKEQIHRLVDKIDELVMKWNIGNPLLPYEKKIIDLTPIFKGK